MTDPSPRRTCPACARRWAGLVSADCAVCGGEGVLVFAAAALHYHRPEAISRAIELHLERRTREHLQHVPYGERADALSVVVDELRLARVVAPRSEAPGTLVHPRLAGEVSRTVAEAEAVRFASVLGSPPTEGDVAALAAPPESLREHRRTSRRPGPPQVSSTGYTTATARAADPLVAVGPDVAVVENTRRRHEHEAKVLTEAVSILRTRREEEPPSPPRGRLTS